MSSKKNQKKRLIESLVTQNRKARHNYFIEDKVEAGIVLTGTEIKALRSGKVNISDSYAIEKGGELWLINIHISEYASAANLFNHEPKRPRKLLLHRREISRLIGAVNRQGVTLVPLSIYFNKRGIAKVNLGIARGKHTYDKRQSVKDRDWQRQKARILRDR